MHIRIYRVYLVECMFITYYIYYYHNPVVDFVSIDRRIITFEPGETRKVYNITIIDDVIPEDSEFFNLDVNLADSSDARFVTIGTPKQPLVEILYKDGEFQSKDNCSYNIILKPMYAYMYVHMCCMYILCPFQIGHRKKSTSFLKDETLLKHCGKALFHE